MSETVLLHARDRRPVQRAAENLAAREMFSEGENALSYEPSFLLSMKFHPPLHPPSTTSTEHGS